MATQQATMDDLLERVARLGRVTTRKMFGEFCVYLDAKPVAFVCDDVLYVKPTAAGRALVPGAAEGPAYPGSKLYLMFPPEDWTDRDALCSLLLATFDELPALKPKKKRA